VFYELPGGSDMTVRIARDYKTGPSPSLVVSFHEGYRAIAKNAHKITSKHFGVEIPIFFLYATEGIFDLSNPGLADRLNEVVGVFADAINGTPLEI
jgi:hypothetical protein